MLPTFPPDWILFMPVWLLSAVGAAFFAGITAILAKVGIRHTPSHLATALRTGVVLVFAWLVAFLVGSIDQIRTLDERTWIFLAASGLATGVSWLTYFRALQLADVNLVTPIDKSSVILTVAFAILLLGETESLAFRLFGITLIGVGTYLMVELDRAKTADGRWGSWVIYAVISAVAAALTSILGSIGIQGVESNLGVAIRTTVVLAMAWIVAIASGEHRKLRSVPRRDLLFLVFSGLATGASWLFFYRALQDGPVSVVVPVDKLSILVTVGFATFVLKEKLSRRGLIGLVLITAGTLVMLF